MLDFNHGTVHPATPDGINDRFNAAIDAALVTSNARETPRNYVGVSSIGNACARKIQYDFTDTPKDEDKGFSGRTLRKFGAGHYFEDDTAELMRDAGFDLQTHRPEDGSQFGFEALDGKFSGHIDGVICGGPTWLCTPCLWEHKAVGHKSFSKHQKNNILQANKTYAAQIAVYQAYLNLTENPAVFTVRNTDTQEIYWELVPFNAPLAQDMSDRAVNIVKATEAGETLPRAFAQSTHFECRWCSYAKTCWGDQ